MQLEMISGLLDFDFCWIDRTVSDNFLSFARFLHCSMQTKCGKEKDAIGGEFVCFCNNQRSVFRAKVQSRCKRRYECACYKCIRTFSGSFIHSQVNVEEDEVDDGKRSFLFTTIYTHVSLLLSLCLCSCLLMCRSYMIYENAAIVSKYVYI